MTALFIPLKSEFYEQFKSGLKTQEFRIYGKRWNNKTCKIGREVILSKGYNNKDCRLTGAITGFKKINGKTLPIKQQQNLTACFGIIDTDIAVITINLIK